MVLCLAAKSFECAVLVLHLCCTFAVLFCFQFSVSPSGMASGVELVAQVPVSTLPSTFFPGGRLYIEGRVVSQAPDYRLATGMTARIVVDDEGFVEPTRPAEVPVAAIVVPILVVAGIVGVVVYLAVRRRRAKVSVCVFDPQMTS